MPKPLYRFAYVRVNPADPFADPPDPVRQMVIERLEGMWALEDGPSVYLPSAETIAAETAAIRSGWSEAEYRLRAGIGVEAQTC